MTVASRGVDAAFVTDWAKFRAAGVTWGSCKATEGVTFTDDSFAANWHQLATELDTRLAYHFAHPESSASAQVDHFLRVVDPKPGDVLVCDLERGTTQKATNAWTRTFLTGIRETGCAVGLYMGTGYAGTDTGRGLSEFADFWWTARYPGLTSWPTSVNPQLKGNTTGWRGPHIWQWTDRYLGKYDANVSTLTAEQIATPGGNMPLTDADAAVLWGHPLPSKRIDPTTGKPTGAEIPAAAYLTSVDVNVWTILQTLTLAQIASAVKAVLPPGQGGDVPTADQIAEAVIAKLAAQLGGSS